MKKLIGVMAVTSLLFSIPFMVQGAESAMGMICAPTGITALPDGGLLVTDTFHKVIWRVADGTATVYAGTPGVKALYEEPAGGYYDGTADLALFGEPWGIAPFLDGYAVSDPKNQVIRLIDGSGVRTAVGSGKPGYADGRGTKAILNRPTGLAADENGNLYIADTQNQCIRKVTPTGEVSTYAKGLSDPTGLCYKNGILYVADSGSHRILAVTEGNVLVVAGSGEEGTADGPAEQSRFSSPQGVAVDDGGIIYVSDTGNRAVRKIENGVVTTIMAGDPEKLDSYPTSPMGILIQGDTLYICDDFSRMLLTEKVR